jgi:hypothetical protein
MLDICAFRRNCSFKEDLDDLQEKSICTNSITCSLICSEEDPIEWVWGSPKNSSINIWKSYIKFLSLHLLNHNKMKKKMRILNFTFRGEPYKVDEKGRINANGIGYYSYNWIFLGGTKHHWSNHITVSLSDAFDDPSKLNGCLGFDIDHGTIRGWGGSYNGKLPRITNAYITTE